MTRRKRPHLPSEPKIEPHHVACEAQGEPYLENNTLYPALPPWARDSAPYTPPPDRPDPAPDDQDPLPPKKRVFHSQNLPKDSPVHVRQHLRRITGIDLTAVDGLSLDLVQKNWACQGSPTTRVEPQPTAAQQWA